MPMQVLLKGLTVTKVGYSFIDTLYSIVTKNELHKSTEVLEYKHRVLLQLSVY